MNKEPDFFPIQSLTFDPELQIRTEISEDTISLYAEQMETEEDMKAFPPVVIFYDGVKYWLADGHHRRGAAEKAGHDKVWAIVKSGTHADAIWGAILGNGKQGFGLTKEDRKRAIEIAIRKLPEMSMRIIADAVGCSPQTVMRIKDQVFQLEHLNDTKSGEQRTTGKDGKSYPAKQKSSKTKAAENQEVETSQGDSTSVEETPASEISTLFPDEKPGFKPGSPEEEKYSSKTQLKPIPRNRPDILVANLISFFPQDFVPNTAREVFRQLFERYGKEVTKPLAAEIYAKYGKK